MKSALQLAKLPHKKKTWFGCTNLNAALHRHLTVLLKLEENREGRL